MILRLFLAIVFYSIGIYITSRLSPEWVFYAGWITGTLSTILFFGGLRQIRESKKNNVPAKGE